MSSKTTLPFEEQYPGWFTLAAFFPELFGAFQQAKPQMFNQIFGQGFDQSQLDPYRRFTTQYQPFDYLASNPFGRPGGTTPTEQGVLNNSLFGLTAPLDLSGPQGIAGQQAAFNQAMFPGGGGGFGTTPSGPLPFNPATASGMSYTPGQGWQLTNKDPSLVYYGPTDTSYYQGKQLTPAEASQLLAQGPSAAGGMQGAMTQGIFNSLGGQLPMPTTGDLPGILNALGGGLPGGAMGLPTPPTAPTIPGAPSLPPFTFDTASYAKNAYNSLIGGQPGLAGALQASLNPQIALPGQNIFQQVGAQSGAGGPMDQYVQRATEGTTKAFENELAKQQLALNSRFAGEGVFGSGANLGALSNLTADATAQYAGIIGPMQLQAANQERDRIYQAASTQYGTEYARNLVQVQMQADDALKMQQTFASMAQSSGSSQAAAQAQAYGQQAQYLRDIYNTQVNALEQTYGTQANIYGSQLGAYDTQRGQLLNAATNIFGIETGAATSQQGQVLAATTQAMQLLQNGLATSWDEAFKMAMANQANQQDALTALQNSYYQPGANLLQGLQPFFHLPTVSKTTGPGFNIGGALQGLGSLGGLFGGGGGGAAAAAGPDLTPYLNAAL